MADTPACCKKFNVTYKQQLHVCSRFINSCVVAQYCRWLGCKAVVVISGFKAFHRDRKFVKLQGCCFKLPGCKLGSKAAWLHGCMAVQLQGCMAVQLQGCMAARLQGCMAARLHSCMAERLQGCKAAWLHSCTAARLHGCTAARLQGCKAV